jgi:hypothetical protein
LARRLRREFAAAPIDVDAPFTQRPAAYGEIAESEGYVAALLDLAARPVVRPERRQTAGGKRN